MVAAREMAAVCQVCDHYVGPVTQICELIEGQLEADAAGRRGGCCDGWVVAATVRVQQEGGCPADKF